MQRKPVGRRHVGALTALPPAVPRAAAASFAANESPLARRRCSTPA